MIRTIDSDQLLAFVAVARERSFSRAARQLAKTQSAVSQSVARLEQDLGERLFVRSGRTTQLTPAGRALREHAQRVLDEMESIRTRFQARSDLREGELVVGTSDTLAYYLLPPVFAAYRARYPGVDLRLDNRPSPMTALRVAEYSVDVGVVTLPLPSDLDTGGVPVAERLQIEILTAQPDVVICPARHPLARQRRPALEALLQYPLLLLDRTTGSRRFLEAQWERLGVYPKIAMEMSSVEVLKRLVELGFGISVVPELSVEREVAAGVLAAVRLPNGFSRRHVGLVTASAGSLAPTAQAFVEIARGMMARRSE